MPTGKVKWFNNAKGYGFIVAADNPDDIFAHYSAIEMEGYKTLRAGQLVDFELANGDKGIHAEHIKVADTEGGSENLDTGTAGNVLPLSSQVEDNYNC